MIKVEPSDEEYHCKTCDCEFGPTEFELTLESPRTGRSSESYLCATCTGLLAQQALSALGKQAADAEGGGHVSNDQIEERLLNDQIKRRLLKILEEVRADERAKVVTYLRWVEENSEGVFTESCSRLAGVFALNIEMEKHIRHAEDVEAGDP